MLLQIQIHEIVRVHTYDELVVQCQQFVEELH